MMLQIGLSSWIIQDGNYGEFEAKREYRFALEFYPHELVFDPSPISAPRLTAVGNDLYDAKGRIIFKSKSAWVIDFGVPAFQETKPPSWSRVGTSVSGRISLGIDPFFYFETLKSQKGMPNLFRQWFVHRILLETTPWREETDATGRKVLSRDNTQESFIEVAATNAWSHDGGHAQYILECEMRESEDV